MEKPIIEEKLQSKYHLLPKSEQFDIIQRYRDSKYPSARKPITAEQADIIERTEELFISEVINWNLGNEWMQSIGFNRP